MRNSETWIPVITCFSWRTLVTNNNLRLLYFKNRFISCRWFTSEGKKAQMQQEKMDDLSFTALITFIMLNSFSLLYEHLWNTYCKLHTLVYVAWLYTGAAALLIFSFSVSLAAGTPTLKEHTATYWVKILHLLGQLKWFGFVLSVITLQFAVNRSCKFSINRPITLSVWFIRCIPNFLS